MANLPDVLPDVVQLTPSARYSNLDVCDKGVPDVCDKGVPDGCNQVAYDSGIAPLQQLVGHLLPQSELASTACLRRMN